MSKVILSYQRDSGFETSSGSIVTDLCDGLVQVSAVNFQQLDFLSMMGKLSTELRQAPEAEVFIHRTDREGLVPYKLDEKTVTLIREDPVAAAEAMTYRQTGPSTAIKRARERNVVIEPQPVRIGFDVLAEAFGDDVYFRVRGHELECPGCGFWSPFTSPGLLNDPDRVKTVFMTAFVCHKKCRGRFVVRCWEKWGSVPVDYLLKNTKLDVFYFPRPWNPNRGGRVTRAELQTRFDQYNKEKESCSTTT